MRCVLIGCGADGNASTAVSVLVAGFGGVVGGVAHGRAERGGARLPPPRFFLPRRGGGWVGARWQGGGAGAHGGVGGGREVGLVASWAFARGVVSAWLVVVLGG